MSKTCPDCGVTPGELHREGCDVERCPECGHQRISCFCETARPAIPWSGEWPGAAECREYGFWCHWDPPWVRCDEGHPGATEDLNRLLTECRWDADLRRFVRRL